MAKRRSWVETAKAVYPGETELAAAQHRADQAEARVAELAAALRDALAALELPEVTEESSDCPGCNAIVDWRGDYAPDIGDCVACDECVAERRANGERILRAALARLDALATEK